MITINYQGVEMEVDGVYTPGEECTMYDRDGGGSPSMPSKYEAHEIYIEGVEVMLLLEEHVESIENLVINKIEKR